MSVTVTAAAALAHAVLARAPVLAGTVLAGHPGLAHGAVLAKAEVSSNDVTPGVLGFLVVAGMGIALYFLLRSMNRQLRKIPPPPPEDGEEGADAPAVTTFPAPHGDRAE